MREAFHRGRYGKVTGLLDGYGGILLDIGCGRPCESMGDYSFIEYAGGGVGCDLRRCGRPPKGCLFAVSDVLALPFRDGCFDRIVALEVLEHVADAGCALESVSRALKPGGILVVSTPANNFLWKAVWSVWVRTVGRMWLDTHKTELGAAGWLRLFSGRFEVLEARTHWGIDLVVKMRKV